MAVLSEAEIQQRLGALPQWRVDVEGMLVRELTLADFAAAIALVNGVAGLAEAADHHPDILVHGYRRVRLALSTHSEGGLTAADFALAGQIEQLA